MSTSDSQRYGKYILLNRIAKGGMAEIFKAKVAGAEGFEKELVIKRILPHLCEDENFIRMFVDEAHITAKLQHPNIVQIFDFDSIDDSYYIAMEYVEGKDLKDVIEESIRQQDELSTAQVAFIIAELAKCLHYAHTREDRGKPLNIVHRDVTPSNVMISYRGDVKLMDFGIAKAAERSTKTKAGMVKGKVAYMSPEQARGHTLDGRSDIFALGVMMWEMLARRRLFLAENDFDTLSNVLTQVPERISKYNRACPPEVQAIVDKCLAKDREDRWVDGEALSNALTRWYYTHVEDPDREKLRALMVRLFRYDIDRLERGDDDTQEQHRNPALRVQATAVKRAMGRSETYAREQATDPNVVAASMADVTLTNRVYPREDRSRRRPSRSRVKKQKKRSWVPWLIVLLLFAGGGAAAAIVVSSAGQGPAEPTSEAERQPEPETREARVEAPTEKNPEPAPAEPTEPGEPDATTPPPEEPATETQEAKTGPGDEPTAEEAAAEPTSAAAKEPSTTPPAEEPTEPAPVTSELLITLDPPDATVMTSQGHIQERGPGVVAITDLEPGSSLSIEIKAKNRKTFKRRINVTEQSQTLSIGLDKLPARAPAQPAVRPTPRPRPTGSKGSIMVSARPWAQVTVNGRPYGTTPTQVKNLPAGKYTVVLTKGHQKVTRNVAVAPGKQAKIFFDFTSM